MSFRLENLGKKTGTEFIEAFASIPEDTKILDLSENSLSKKTGSELNQAFSTIPVSVTSLNLRKNNFFSNVGSELAQAFAGITPSVTTLDLSENFLFNKKTNAELALAFAAIPANVTHLSLRKNGLYVKTVSDIAEILRIIPASVTSLDLKDNHLSQKTGAELEEAFAAIGPGVRVLDLSNNNIFGMKPFADFNKALHAMPANIETVIIDDKNIDMKNLRKIALLEQKISAEITRLRITSSTGNNFWVNIGVIEASDTKIQALEELKTILKNGTCIKKNVEDFHAELHTWKEENGGHIAKQRNSLHSFFSPSHKPAAAYAVDMVFAELQVDNKRESVKSI